MVTRPIGLMSGAGSFSHNCSPRKSVEKTNGVRSVASPPRAWSEHESLLDRGEHFFDGRCLQLLERLGFNLPDPLPRHG